MNNQQSQLIQQAEEIKRLRDGLNRVKILAEAIKDERDWDNIHSIWLSVDIALTPTPSTYGDKALAVVEAAIKISETLCELPESSPVTATEVVIRSNCLLKAVKNLQGGE